MRDTKRRGISAAAAVLMRKRIGKHETHAFGYRDKPLTQINANTWRASRGYAGSFQTLPERN